MDSCMYLFLPKHRFMQRKFLLILFCLVAQYAFGQNDFSYAVNEAPKKINYKKIREELKASMLNESAPSFTLYDLNGNKISNDDLKGKVSVLDFWSTWCGPCKASFPGMQKIITKYTADKNVIFVFIDNWEKVIDKKKNATDFININKYNFQVLLDEDSKVVTQFKVEGIPTKFVLDKNGNIRFKTVGFDNNEDKLAAELKAIIELASK
ncbi:MAG: hypothetical protein C4329_01110 [Chitinophagaceae bacterium]